MDIHNDTIEQFFAQRSAPLEVVPTAPNDSQDTNDGIFPSPLPVSTSVATAQCSLCGNQTIKHRKHIAAVCAVCAREAPARLDSLELAMVEAEERLVAAYWRFDQIMQNARQADRDRYDHVCKARIEAVSDADVFDKLKRRIAKTIAQGDGLSAILKAEQERDTACSEAGDAIARIREHQIILIAFAPEWTIPDAVTERRKAMSGQRLEPATQQTALAI